jgi:hypothetical protein
MYAAWRLSSGCARRIREQARRPSGSSPCDHARDLALVRRFGLYGRYRSSRRALLSAACGSPLRGAARACLFGGSRRSSGLRRRSSSSQREITQALVAAGAVRVRPARPSLPCDSAR